MESGFYALFKREMVTIDACKPEISCRQITSHDQNGQSIKLRQPGRSVIQ